MAELMKIVVITIVFFFHVACAARIIPANNSTSNNVEALNITASNQHSTRPQARSLYTDGEGTYVGSDSVHDYASGVKCWTDYFVVTQGIWFDNWVKASGNIYCTGTSSCEIDHMDGHETCQSWSIELDAGIESEIVNFGVTAGYEHEDCNTGTDTTACTWSDQQCHCIWTQQQMTSQNGYMRRRCSSSTGDYTAWITNWVHNAPTNYVNYGCGSSCTDT